MCNTICVSLCDFLLGITNAEVSMHQHMFASEYAYQYASEYVCI